MSESHLLSKINVSKKDDYLVIDLEEALTDTEFLKLKNVVLKKVSKNSTAGVIIDINTLTVIDSFTTKIFQDLAHSIAYMERPMALVGIKDDVSAVMEKQGLSLADGLIERSGSVTEAINKFNNHSIGYN